MASINFEQIHKALENSKQQPARVYQIDSRHSTPPVYPEYGLDEFEHWRETLETITHSLEGFDPDTPANTHRIRIANDQYWREESNHWKALFMRSVKTLNIGNSTVEKHHLDIDTRYWGAINSLDWRVMYEILDSQRTHQITGDTVSNLEARRSTASDIIYYRVAAEHWEALCKVSVNDESIDLTKYRTTIRSASYWSAEFDGLSQALQRLMAGGGRSAVTGRRITRASRKGAAALGQGRLTVTHKKGLSSPVPPNILRQVQQTAESRDSEVAKIPPRRSKRIRTTTKNETLSSSAKPQGIRRREIQKKKRL